MIHPRRLLDLPLIACFGSLVLTAGCSSSSDGTDEPAPGDGPLEYHMVTSIEASAEVEHCQFFKTPAEGLVVQRTDIAFDSGSHHVLVYETGYDEIPTENDRGEAVDTSKPFDCSAGATDGWSVTKLIGASQNADGEPALSLPENIGVRVKGDTVIMINAHYINTTTGTITPDVKITFRDVAEEDLEEEGDIVFWYNPFIYLPGNSKATATASCEVHEDIQLVNAQSHMHARGIGYKATLFAPGKDPQVIYENEQWEDVPVKSYAPELAIPAGSRIEWSCEYENGEGQDIYQGTRTTDEMCMFIGSYYPKNQRTGLCSSASAPDQQFFGGTWRGTGDKGCAETLACLQENPMDQHNASLCVTNSRPEVAEKLSAAVNCFVVSGLRGEADPLSACSTELQACAAAD